MKCIALLLVLAACKHGSTPATTDFTEAHTTLADDTEAPPPYDTAAVQRALIAERAGEARDERLVAEAEGDANKLPAALANLAVRRRFIRILEVCESQTRLCPPRLDDPPWPYTADSAGDPKLEVPLRFDLDSWQKVTAELHGRSCVCRTVACLDSMEVTLARLETRPTEEVQADDTAILHLTHARECMLRLRGKRAMPKLATQN